MITTISFASVWRNWPIGYVAKLREPECVAWSIPRPVCREFAVLAGLGWIGKNTLLLNRQLGSWFFLAALATDLELDYDPADSADHCGTCRACLDACPTEAFVAPCVLDARRCISYLTIELREPIPATCVAASAIGCSAATYARMFAPGTTRRRGASSRRSPPVPAATRQDWLNCIALDDEEFRRRFRDTPLSRAQRAAGYCAMRRSCWGTALFARDAPRSFAV